MRIVSLSPSSTEILFALGAGDEIIGVTQACDYPAEARRRPQLGSWLHTQPAAIKALQPDLIVTTSYFPEELRTYSGQGEVLHLDPSSLASILETIIQLGRATGRYQAAEVLVQNMQREFEAIRATAPAKKLLVYSETWPSPPMQAGNWVPELIEIAGGISVGGLHARPSTKISVDALQSADPDLMIFHWCDPNEKPDIERIKLRQGWTGLRAIQANACAFLPDNLLNRPGPRLVDGVRQIQTVLARYQHVL